MKEFDFELLDISTASNETISALGDALWHLTSARCEEEGRIDQEFDGVLESLLDSFNPKQQKLFERYQQQEAELLCLAEKRRFICGFKAAMRLALESMK